MRPCDATWICASCERAIPYPETACRECPPPVPPAGRRADAGLAAAAIAIMVLLVSLAQLLG